ncbi:MAG: GDP-mannose 4,6-dehydratase [Candidatus Brocadiae bacterium]|nr:GDP-mannose 4,6-dehydratase [Candidatus Brocadiia bacterium]
MTLKRGCRALITGGAGFIGSHLAEFLLARGDRVSVIDDLSTGAIANIEHLKTEARFRYTIDSIFNESLLAEQVDDADVVFHLAAAVGVRLIVEKPTHTIETNIRGTEMVLRAAAKKGRRVFVASTSEVYGKSAAVPFREDADLVLGPTSKSRWSYAASKAVDEFLALAYHKERGLPVVIARLFNTVGPRQTGRYGMVIPRFVEQALAGGPITVFGDGRQTRCFAWVGDVVRGIAALADQPAAAGQVFNLGATREISILALARLIAARVGGRIPIRKIPYDRAYEEGFEDMRRRVPSIARARKAIGYRPTVDIDEILDRVIAHARDASRMA